MHAYMSMIYGTVKQTGATTPTSEINDQHRDLICRHSIRNVSTSVFATDPLLRRKAARAKDEPSKGKGPGPRLGRLSKWQPNRTYEQRLCSEKEVYFFGKSFRVKAGFC